MKDDRDPMADEADLHAFADDRLGPDRRAAVQARLDDDPQAAALARDWSEQRDLLRGLHADVLREPVPAPLLATAQQLERRGARHERWRHWGGMAASILLAFAVGWTGHATWLAESGASVRGPAKAFAHDAVVAYAVYAPEVRHPVEVDASQEGHLVQWLSRRLDRPLKIPDLGAQGWQLVGGRLLPGEHGARAQFMYQNSAGGRLTLYLGALDAPAAAEETGFRFMDDGTVQGFYWVDRGFGYALAGELPRTALQDLAGAVYRQLEP